MDILKIESNLMDQNKKTSNLGDLKITPNTKTKKI